MFFSICDIHKNILNNHIRASLSELLRNSCCFEVSMIIKLPFKLGDHCLANQRKYRINQSCNNCRRIKEISFYVDKYQCGINLIYIFR